MMIAPQRILLSAYACEPNRGSEPGVGWNWALALVRAGHEVWVLTRSNNRSAINSALRSGLPVDQSRIHFIYYDPPQFILKLKRLGLSVNLFYGLWQFGASGIVKNAHAQYSFTLIHHLTFGVWRQASRLWKLGPPLIFGPVGGGEVAPWALLDELPNRTKAIEFIRIIVDGVAALNPALRACLRNATLVIAKTPETANRIETITRCHLTTPEIGVDAINLGISERMRTAGPSRTLRCLFAGRLLGWKGVHLAVEAIAKAKRDGLDVSLTIIGQGPMQSHLDLLIQNHKLEGCVKMIPWLSQPELFSQYSCHDVLLFPSLHDSSGNVVLEAFAHWLPAVCLDLGGPSVLVDENSGILVHARNRSSQQVVDELAAALYTLHADPVRLDSLREGARARALGMTWDAAVERVYSMLPTPQKTQLSIGDLDILNKSFHRTPH